MIIIVEIEMVENSLQMVENSLHTKHKMKKKNK